MTTMEHDARTSPTVRRCGCCGQPRARLTELGDTPGVYICAGCALWAARRAGGLPSLSLRAAVPPLRALTRRLRRDGGDTVRAAIPILASTDLDRSAEFYCAIGLDVAGLYDSYLVLHDGPVELHLALVARPAPVGCFLHVPAVVPLWKRLREQAVPGVGPLEDQDYGLREFTLTDPDGNRVRIGSPTG